MPEAKKKAPQIQRRESWVQLPDEYEGFEFKLWLNAPSKLWVAIGQAGAAGSEDEAQAALAKIVLEHNGWLDFEGNEYPQPGQADFWEEIPTELAACMLVVCQEAMGRLPNSLAAKRRR